MPSSLDGHTWCFPLPNGCPLGLFPAFRSLFLGHGVFWCFFFPLNLLWVPPLFFLTNPQPPPPSFLPHWRTHPSGRHTETLQKFSRKSSPPHLNFPPSTLPPEHTSPVEGQLNSLSYIPLGSSFVICLLSFLFLLVSRRCRLKLCNLVPTFSFLFSVARLGFFKLDLKGDRYLIALLEYQVRVITSPTPRLPLS